MRSSWDENQRLQGQGRASWQKRRLVLSSSVEEPYLGWRSSSFAGSFSQVRRTVQDQHGWVSVASTVRMGRYVSIHRYARARCKCITRAAVIRCYLGFNLHASVLAVRALIKSDQGAPAAPASSYFQFWRRSCTHAGRSKCGTLHHRWSNKNAWSTTAPVALMCSGHKCLPIRNVLFLTCLRQ